MAMTIWWSATSLSLSCWCWSYCSNDWVLQEYWCLISRQFAHQYLQSMNLWAITIILEFKTICNFDAGVAWLKHEYWDGFHHVEGIDLVAKECLLPPHCSHQEFFVLEQQGEHPGQYVNCSLQCFLFQVICDYLVLEGWLMHHLYALHIIKRMNILQRKLSKWDCHSSLLWSFWNPRGCKWWTHYKSPQSCEGMSSKCRCPPDWGTLIRTWESALCNLLLRMNLPY